MDYEENSENDYRDVSLHQYNAYNEYMDKSKDVDAYIAKFEGIRRERLEKMREIITTTVPEAVESVSYGLAGYKLYGKPLVYFGGFPNHIGFYATPDGNTAFSAELSQYKQGKGSVQFPLDQPLPVDLITNIVRFKKQQLGG